jgi:hypothetical protein
MRVMDILDLGKTANYEIIELTDNANGTGVTWDATRGVEGTTPWAHAANWTAIPVVTAGGLDGRYGEGGNVSSVFGRNGAVVAAGGDYSVAQVSGAAPIDSPELVTPSATSSPAPTDNSLSLATMAAVQAAITTALSTGILPTAPFLTGLVPGNTQVVLTWTAPLNQGASLLTGYQILRSTSTGTEVSVATVGATVLTYTDTALTNSTAYFYKVAAVNSNGVGALSNEQTATPMSAPTAPSAPTLLNVTPADGQVALTWRAPSSNGGSTITGNTILRGTTSGGETTLDSVGASVLTYTDTTAANGTTYYYKVEAINGVGSSAPSNELSATPTSSTTVGFSQTAMGLPVNGSKSYSLTDLIFHDKMQGTGTGTGLDLTKWWPRWGGPGTSGPSVWDDNGHLASPYSGPNAPPTTEGELLHPSMIAVSDGMTITAESLPGGSPYNGTPYSQYVSLSGGMTSDNISQLIGHPDGTGSTAAFRLPNTGFYLQILCKLPDMQHGASGTLWLLDPTGGAPEIDILQGGFGIQEGATGSAINQYPCCAGIVSHQAIPNMGVDCSLAFHKYGLEWIPATSLKLLFDGTVMKTWTAPGTTIPAGGGYEILMQLTTWLSGLGYVTGYTGSTYTFEVAEVAAYAF